MAFDWTGVIDAVTKSAPSVITAIKTQPTNPLAGGGYLPSATGVPMVPIPSSVGETIADVLSPVTKPLATKSVGAALKQYWWVIAIPSALLLALLLKPLFTKKRW